MGPEAMHEALRGSRIAIRADGSTKIGIGHLMRCLTLARLLADAGADVAFVSAEAPDSFREQVEQSDLAWLSLGDSVEGELEDAQATARVVATLGGVDWVVVDHYSLGETWESRMRECATGVAVVDDGPGRRHDCDLLFDQNAGSGERPRYEQVVPEGCALVLGPEHALLRPEFLNERARLRERDGTVRAVLVSMGWGDHDDVTSEILRALERVHAPDLEIHVVVGSGHPDLARLHEIAGRLPGVELHVDATDMAHLMAQADLAIGGGGSSSWERCFLGLPSLVAAIAENQEPVVRALVAGGAARLLGESLSTDAVQEVFEWALACPSELEAMSEKALTLVGDPTPSRWNSLLRAFGERWVVGAGRHRLRRMEDRDSDRVLAWRDSMPVRRYMVDDRTIDPEGHAEWFERAVRSPDAEYLVYEREGHAAGLGYLTGIGGEQCEWGFYLGESGLPPGTGTALCCLLLERAFRGRSLDIVSSRVFAGNEASLRIHEKMGFEDEGETEAARGDGVTRRVRFLVLDRWRWEASREGVRECLVEECDRP